MAVASINVLLEELNSYITEVKSCSLLLRNQLVGYIGNNMQISQAYDKCVILEHSKLLHLRMMLLEKVNYLENQIQMEIDGEGVLAPNCK